MMQVIHTIPATFQEASGPSYSVVRLCESLIAQGKKVTLSALEWAPMSSPLPFLKTFPLGLGPRRLGRSPAMVRWLVEYAQSRSIELIHNHSLWMMPNVYPGRVAKQYRIPYVVSPRGTLSAWAMGNGSKVKKAFWPLVQRPALEAVTCFHGTAESECEDIRRMGFKQPVAIIPNGIDIPLLKRVPRNEVRTLLFLGRIHPKKGLDFLIKAWQVVSPRFPEWHLRIIGPDNDGYLPRIEALASELKLARIAFYGPLYGEAKLNAYREAELFVLPTHSENFGMTVAEALAAGTPAIVTRGAPWSGLETHGAGWWIEIGLDPLVSCLEDALAQPRKALQIMGERGREWMESEFSWERVGLQMVETYQWILNGGNKPDWVTKE